MGLEIKQERFVPEDQERFRARLERCLAVLEEMLARPDFGRRNASIGAELEVTLIDEQGGPLALNEEVLRETLDERMTTELDRFNLECNLIHTDLAGRPFAHLRREFESAERELSRAAARHGGRVAMIGILPTLVAEDLDATNMSDAVRYRALSRSLRENRGGPFLLDIDGEDPLQMSCEDVTFEGAATSFQVHLGTAPANFEAVFNAAQLATAPILAAAGNSPIFLQHHLWNETRVALFKQAVDERDHKGARQARVTFGRGWLRNGPIELFRESVKDYAALLPIVSDEDPDEAFRDGRVPSLHEIRLHQGTVWNWNRPVYDPHDGGHVRIELRALPSGPTIEDMLANAAFLIGLSLGLAPTMCAVRDAFDFELAHANFYRAAQSGLDAKLVWPESLGGKKSGESAQELFPKLADFAREGLRSANIDANETDPLIDCLLERVERGQTGASWQRARLKRLEARHPREEALRQMLEDYLARSREGQPVHRWDVE